MKNLKGEGVAEVSDYSEGRDGSTKVEVPYSFDYTELETAA